MSLCDVRAHASLSVKQAAGCIAISASSCIINSSSVNPLSATTAGSLLVLIAFQNINNTATLSIADSASQTWTQTGGICAQDTSREMQMWYIPNSASVTSIVPTWSGGIGPINADVVYEVAGAAISSPVDQAGACITSGAATSLASATFTTTNANDIVLYGVSVGRNQTTWTADTGKGYAFQSGGTLTGTEGRAAMEYEIFSAIQTSVFTTITWGISSATNQGIVASFKAAATSTFVAEEDGFSVNGVLQQSDPNIVVYGLGVGLALGVTYARRRKILARSFAACDSNRRRYPLGDLVSCADAKILTLVSCAENDCIYAQEKSKTSDVQ